MQYNEHLGDVETFVEKNQKLVWKCVQQYKMVARTKCIELEELFQIGMIGMLKAYEKYDPSKFENVNNFTTYGVPMIHGEILRFLRDFYPVRVPRGKMELLRKIRCAGMMNLSAQEIAEHFDVSEKEVEQALEMRYVEQVQSMDAEIIDYENKEITLHDKISVSADYTGVFVYDFLKSLSEREQTIIEMRTWDATQVEIAQAVGIGQVQVSRMLTRIKNKYLAYCNGETVSPAIELQRKVTRERYEIMAAEGRSNKEIAQEFGCHIKTLKHHQRKWKQAEQAVDLYEATV
ncbi:RNA polymerase sporulation-specific sigma factor [Aneurinibacillus soli]|uniref:RNA polymerase sigma-F factor n=1 Tax=Aneurinibacillus soli TaxID=1500254 RepID=A0A0U4WHR6_9BACL|nr:sigma-70 family RNA polymerase sigma factor [Aneurinibacillus soli]PYE64270.1 RNA polymerase sporulation-specific sigma factor [Aneurinibacillus soli]BAU28219.1 RNA polymerase sigma-F factor [Aneurinibacillus soli]